MTATRILPYHPDAEEFDGPGRFRLPSDPIGTLRFHAYQDESINALLAQRTSAGGTGGGLLADEQGGGKTAVVAEVIARAGFGRVLISVLVDTIPQWRERIVAQGGPEPRVMDGSKKGRTEFEAFLAGEDGVFVTGSQFLVRQDYAYRDKRDVYGRRMWQVDKNTGEVKTKPRPEGAVGPAAVPVPQRERVHLELYRKMSHRKRGGVDAIFVDEVQLFSNRKGVGRRTLGTMRGRELSVAVSGTWFGEQVENQWAVARWVWPVEEIVPLSFHRWKEQWLSGEPVRLENGKALQRENPVTGYRETVMKVTGEKVPGAFTASLPCYLRWENPHRPPAPKVLKLVPTPEQARQLDDLNRDMFAWLMTHEGEDAPLVVDMPMGLQVRLEQITVAELSFEDEEGTMVAMADDAASAKLAAMRGVLEHYFHGEPAVIFTHSKIGAILYARRMAAAGVRVGAYHGDMRKEERAAVKAAFIAGELDYLVATIQACGTGVDGLQLRANKMLWVSKVPGRPAMNDQALFRLFRAGITGGWESFEQVELLIDHPGSPDIDTWEALIAKQWVNVQALRGGMKAAA